MSVAAETRAKPLNTHIDPLIANLPRHFLPVLAPSLA